MTIEDEIRSALHDDAGTATPPPDGWDDVRARAEAHTRRRRAIRYPVAGLVAAAAIAAIVVGVAALRTSSESEPPSIATPSSVGLPDEIVSVGDDSLVVLDSQTGRIVRSLTTGRASSPTVSPGGDVFYSRSPACEIARVPITGGRPDVVGSGFFAQVSPDGRWLAVLTDANGACERLPQSIEIVDLNGEQPERSLPITTGDMTFEFLDWSADSARLLVRTIPKGTEPHETYELDISGNRGSSYVTPGPGYPVLYLGGTGLLAAALFDRDFDGFQIESIEPATGAQRQQLVRGAHGSVVTLSSDASGRHLLYWVATDNGGTQTLVRHSTGEEPVRLRSERATSSGGLPAVWVPRREPSVPATTTPETTRATTPTSTTDAPRFSGPETVVAVDRDSRLVELDSADGSERREIRAAPLDGSKYETVSVGPDGSVATSRVGVTDDYCQTFDTGQIELVDGAGNVETVGQGRYPTISPDGKRIAWVGVADCQTVLRLHDFATGTDSVLVTPPATDGGPDPQLSGPITWAPDSRHLMVPMNVEPARDWWYIDADADDGILSGPVIKQRGELGGPFAVAFGSPALLTAAIADPDGSNIRIAFLNLATGEEQGALRSFYGGTPGEPIVLELQSDVFGDRILMTVVEGGERKLYRLDGPGPAMASGIQSADW